METATSLQPNGVVSGSGTISNPFIIAGWKIAGDTANCIEVRDTTAYFAIRNVALNALGASNNGTVLYDVFGGTIENSSIRSNSWGISIILSHNTTITGVSTEPGISDYGTGIFIGRSADITLSGDSVMSSGFVYANYVNQNGLDIQDSVHVQVRGVQIRVRSESFGADIFNSTIVSISNSVFGGGDGGAAGLAVSNSSQVVITNSVASGGVCGVLCLPDGFWGTGNHELELLNDQGGKAWIEGNNVTISYFTGTIVHASGSNLTLSSNDVEGLSLQGSVVSVLDNRVNGCDSELGIGGFLIQGSELLVEGNKVSYSCAGVVVSEASDTLLLENTVFASGRGIILQSSSNVRVFHNNIINNALQASDDNPGANMWDNGYPSGGNFWSNYNGTDHCSGPGQNVCPSPDGIGDTPYTFAFGKDNYPLIHPFAPPLTGSVVYSPGSVSSENRGRYLSAIIRLPPGINFSEVVASSLRLNGTLSPVSQHALNLRTVTGTHEIIAKFSLTQVETLLHQPGTYALEVTMNIVTSTSFRPFTASATIRLVS